MMPAALALLAAGCHAAPAGPGQAVNQQITVAAVPGFANAPLQVAVREGLFARYHVDVNVQTYPTLQRAYAALGSGQAEVISGDYAGLLYAQSHPSGARLRLIADGYDATPGVMEVLTLPGSPITNPQQLEGKTVGTPLPELAPFSADAPYNVETLATEAVLQTDEVSPSSVVWKPMPADDMITALRDHQVSAIVAAQPYILQARDHARRGGVVRCVQRGHGQPAAVRVLHHGRLRPRLPGRAARLPGRAHRGQGQHRPAGHGALGAEHPARDDGAAS